MARRNRGGGGTHTIEFHREECSTHGTLEAACTDACELEEKTYEVTASVSGYVPAKISGPPENCYPAEGGEVEIESITLDGKEVEQNSFSPKELAQMDEKLFEAMMDDDGGYDEDYERDRDDDF